MLSRFRIPVFTFVFPVLAPIAASAQTAPAQTTPPTIHETVVVTATGREMPDSKVGASITVLDRREIEQRHALSTIDLLRTVPGVGAWTAAEVARPAFGDPDAISLGDFHLPNLVCWALAGEPRGDDATMLELLEPYRGQRARLVRLLEHSGIRAPRYGPRSRIRSIERL